MISLIFSKIFEKTESREIGRKSSSDWEDETFGIGTTYAILNDSGNISSYMQLLNNFASIGVKIQLDIFTNLAGISSISCAELILMLLIPALTSSSVVSRKTKGCILI